LESRGSGKGQGRVSKLTKKMDLEMIEMVDSTWDRSQVARLEPVMEL
jgi:hypothetical protein